MLFPLYIYPDNTGQQSLYITAERIPNLFPAIVEGIVEKLGLIFSNEKITSQDVPETFAPIDILDYIYAVLYSPTYREKYKEFLKTNFHVCCIQKMRQFSGN